MGQYQGRMFPCLLLSLTPLAGASPLLPLKYPSYLRNKVGKREDSYGDSWHFGKKRSPWTGAWANIVWRPEGVDLKTPEKRDPQPSLSIWNSPIGGYLSSPRALRYNQIQSLPISPNLLLKRGLEFNSNLNSVPMMGKREDEQEIASDNEDIQHYNKSLM